MPISQGSNWMYDTASAAYDVENSCRFHWNSTNNAGNDQSFMYDTTWTGTPTSTTTGCFSTWFKNSLSNSVNQYNVASFANNHSDSSNRSYIMGDWGSGGNFVFAQKVSGSWNFKLVTDALYRDPAAWVHFFAVWDTSNGTEGDRIRMYVNGERITSFSGEDYPSQNQECFIVSKEDFSVGRAFSTVYGSFTHGYMAETALIDGTAYAVTQFGETDENSGIWKPKDITGLTFGNKGFYFDYKDSSNLGNDVSGNNRDLTLSDIDSTHQTTDTPTNNFCTLNPLWVYGNATTTGPSKGNLRVEGGSWAGTKATFGVDSGKWFWEFKSSNTESIVGIQTDEGVALTGNGHNILSTCALYLNGEVWIKDSTSGRNDTDVTQTFDANSVYQIRLNMDDNEISFYQDGSLITNGGSIALDGLANKVVFPFAANYNSIIDFNFGNPTFSIASGNADENGYGNFEFAPPSGYYALCTKNLAEFG